MKSKISSQVFEWLLAHWAGYGDNPAELFPSLCDADLNDLQAQLTNAIRHAQAAAAILPVENIPRPARQSAGSAMP